jgi:molecular chaperone DnaK
VKLACATLDQVKAKFPELRDRRFVLRTRQSWALDTLVRLETRLSDGTPCFHATAVVERVDPAGPDAQAMTLALIAMDDAGRELVAWLGGKPPRALREAEPAARAQEAAAPHPAPAPVAPAHPMPAAPVHPAPVAPAHPVPAAPAHPVYVAPAHPVRVAPAHPVPAAPAHPVRVAPAHPVPAAPAHPVPAAPAHPVHVASTRPAPRPAPPPPPPPRGASRPAPPPRLAPPPAPAIAATPPASQASEPPPPVNWDAAFPPAPAAPAAAAHAPAPPSSPGWDEPPPAPPPAPETALPAEWGESPPAQAAPPPPEVAAPASWEEAVPAPPSAPGPPPLQQTPPPDAEVVVARAADLKSLEADLPPREPGAPLITPQHPLPAVPPAQPVSRRPAPPPMPRPTLGPAAAPAADAQLVDDSMPVPAARAPGGKKGRIIGIDLGTTNSAAAVVKEGKPFIIPSREGYSTIPSVVALNEKGNVIVGHQAKGQLLINPRTTVYGFKRLVGRQFKSPVVTDLVNRFSYEIAPGLRGEASVKLGDKIFSLQKISSLVLSEVKELAERWLNEPVTRAVITVPAYYNDNQRQAVRAAGALSGLDVERIVNEPTAAAIAFAHGRQLEERVMVYDLGGGTFDTSVLQLHGSVYEVISTGGDTFLGGVDFDKEIVNDLLARFKKKHGIDFTGDRVAYQRINDAAERAKIALSERLSTQVKVPFVSMVGEKAYDVDETINRAELEKLTSALVDRTLRVCDDVLTNCGLKPADLGEVLLVGGQSRMPLVRAKIREFFGKEASRAVHPDEAVALGAALLADSIQTGEIGGIVLMDVLPMSIGVGLPGGRFKKIVERNTPLPHRKTHSVWTSEDQQKMLEIPIFQGESGKAQDNEYLGTLVVADLPPGIRGNVVFDVIFNITAESILTVTAEERGTARSVTATFSTQDTPEAVRRRLATPPAKGAPAYEPPGEGARKGGLLGWIKRKLE